MARVVDCSFQRFSCGHDLFNATYTRSNRTKGTKIMRCFPHCCPEHMPRCYCGCSLHVLVTFEDLRAVDLEDVIVCARFETSEEQEPRHVVRRGATLTIPRVLLSRNADDANATTWIVAEKESEVKQREVTKNSVLFVMNNHRFPRWYYGYESGATKNQRDMRHHLTAYVLLRSQNASLESDTQRVLVLGRLPSPAFKLVSYRRARGEVKNPRIPLQDDPLAALEEQASSTEDEGEPNGSVQGTPTKAPPSTAATRDATGFSSGTESPASTRSTETRGADVPVASLARELARRRAHSSPFVKDDYTRRASDSECKPRRPSVKIEESESTSMSTSTSISRKRKACSPAAKALWWRQHPNDAQRVLHLHVLFVMLSRLSLRDVMFCLRGKSERLSKKWFLAIAESTSQSEAAIRRLAELGRAFCLSVFAEYATNNNEDGVHLEHTPSREVIATCVEVMLEVGTSTAVKQLLEATWTAHRGHMLESDRIRELFVQFVRRLHGAIDTTLRNRRRDSTVAAVGKSSTSREKPAAAAGGGGGIAALVDDAMSTVFREPRLAALRRDMVRALSESTRSAERWYEVFVAQLRVAWVEHHERKASGISLLWQAALTARQPIWTGKWVLDASSYRVRRPGGWFHHQDAPAVAPLGSSVSWVVLLRQWLAVELAMDGCVLTASSLLTGSGARPSMRLVLDERQRVFKCFPDGMASTIGLGGGDCGAWLHGDYVGRGRDDASELLCETYSMRQRGEDDTELLRLSIKASVWDPSARTRRCVVSVQLASATCRSFSATQLLTWPVTARHEQLFARANWSIVADVEAAYIDLK